MSLNTSEFKRTLQAEETTTSILLKNPDIPEDSKWCICSALEQAPKGPLKFIIIIIIINFNFFSIFSY